MPVHGWKLSSFDTLYCAACENTFRYLTDNKSVQQHIKDCKKKNGDKYAKRKQTGTDDIRKFVRRSYEELDKRCREDDKRFGNPMNMDKSTSTAIIDTYVLLREAEAPSNYSKKFCLQ